MILREMFGQHLRWGNFAFQWAANIKLCSEHNCEAWYPDYYLWQYLENPPFIFKEEPKVDLLVRPWRWEWSQEEEDYINTLDFTNNISFALNHFMQSENWFKDYEKEVKESLKAKDEVYSTIRDKYSEVFEKPTIGLGIRLGDFKKHGTFYQIPHNWYIWALHEFFPDWQDYNVVVFSDDINEAKQLFKKYPFKYAEDNNTATHSDNFKHYHGDASEQFFLGTMMDNFICGNSTFTWWQSYLCGGKVVHSGKLFSETGNHAHCDTSNYYPKNWLCCPL